MNKRALTLGAIVVACGALGVLLARELPWTDTRALLPSRSSFAAYRLPADTTQELFDIGIADANGDGVLDIFTSNHNFRQHLWIGDGKGGYDDALSAFGLDQDARFPGAEISRAEPAMAAAGMYFYWKGRKTFAIRAYHVKGMGRISATLRTYSAINSDTNEGMTVLGRKAIPDAGGVIPQTEFSFATDGDGAIDIEIESPGLPIEVELGPSIPLTSVFVGRRMVSPGARTFELRFQDRHAWAWSDYNGDGRIDVFMSRGAVGGTVRSLPSRIADTIQDELFVSRGAGPLHDIAAEVGIDKHECSGRKATWVDFDNDGLLDLFINCEDRGRVAGQYPKQLYRQEANGHLREVAKAVGLGLLGHEIVDFAWLDADNDGYVDLLTFEGKGFFLYRNDGGKVFTPEFVGRGKFVRADNPKLRGTAEEYWYVDGKLAVADFDGDGDLDAFCASKQGSILLVNDGKGHWTLAEPPSRGLPDESATANWVDFDNDGILDLHAIPQGLYRGRSDHTFEKTGLLAFPPHKYMAAIVNWPDFDNDGRRDALMALDENFALWRWWERFGKQHEDRWTWRLYAFRNEMKRNHWLQVRLIGRAGNPQAIGTKVTVQTPSGRQTQVVGLNDGAFFSQGHYRLYFGLGSRARADVVRIRWADGQEQELRDVDGDRLLTVVQSTGKVGGAAK